MHWSLAHTGSQLGSRILWCSGVDLLFVGCELWRQVGLRPKIQEWSVAPRCDLAQEEGEMEIHHMFQIAHPAGPFDKGYQAVF